MENLEDTATPDLEAEVTSLEQTLPSAPLQSSEVLDDSVIVVEQNIDLVDLTSPQPSTSNCAGGTLSVGTAGASGLLKTNIEEHFKDVTADSMPSATLDQNPSSSTTTNVLECPICLQTCIHPARLPCGHIFCFLCVKGVAYKNRRCAMCRREIPPEFLDHPQLVNGIEDICTTKATDDGYQWFYEGRNGGWWAYEKRNATEIEEAYQRLSNKKTNSQTEIKKEEEAKQKLLNKETNYQTQTKTEEKKANVEDEDDENDYDENDYDYDYDANDSDDYYIDDEGADDQNYFQNFYNFLRNNMYKKNLNMNNLNNNPLLYDIQICGSMYTIDFKNMIQYPQYMPYKKRKICRAKGLPAKGIAGISSYTRRPYRNRPY